MTFQCKIKNYKIKLLYNCINHLIIFDIKIYVSELTDNNTTREKW